MSDYQRRLLAVGDIHGHREKLGTLMEIVKPTSEDKIVFLGDYIDRGPDSSGVIDYLLDFCRQFPWTETVFLRGNHEQMFLDALTDRRDMGPSHIKLRDMSNWAKYELHRHDWDLFLMNGGHTTLESYGVSLDSRADCMLIPEEHIDFLKSTRFYHAETVELPGSVGAIQKEFLFVHAGIPVVRSWKGFDPEKQDKFDLLWIREPFINSKSRFGGRIVVHGHTQSLDVPGTAPNRINLDSGVYAHGSDARDPDKRYGKLTCCDVLTRECWQAG
ncbi:MAG: serine/threonine protein phosphatase [Deltaproteobacteria bacterium]|nr:serine/threonine protein phosphatase [Deltaproteobacteria bacterium]